MYDSIIIQMEKMQFEIDSLKQIVYGQQNL